MLRNLFKSKAVRRADEALAAADARLATIDRLGARRSSGSRRLLEQIARLQEIIGEGQR